ncbi:sensor histidine kinase [Pseudoalteromonas sp. G4]|uniref:sensor histidine kinase n=1 Tax=Pseudoalteromonas sp. G4 TaxID=2992761 RepID=UPI00237D57E0|nr:ATP-binding protein [Pseudoalteromonas sp. G4]MDE3272015.1 ATP-binding protein [Pseudoalteromonas sp. G4]
MNTLKNDPSITEELKNAVFDDELSFILSDLDELTAETVKGLNSAKQIMLDLKRFSRGESDVHELSDINKGIQSTLNILRNELKDNCKVHLALNPLPETTVNMGKLNQVFMNLILNAKQSFDSKGDIYISTKVHENNIVITIRDTGCGIPEADLKDIFTPFYTTKPIGEGTGLGLAICYRIICDEHKGKLTVTSSDKGSEFTICIPFSDQHQLQA